MDFFDVIKNRHCVRSFDPQKQVSGNQLKSILDAGRLAPSAGGLQDWHFEIIKDAKIKDELVIASMMQKFISEAPIVITVCVDLDRAEKGYGKRGVELYSIQDTAAATQNMLLTVTALGLNACWVGAFDEEKVKEVLKLPSNLRPVVLIPLGYAR